MITTAFFKSLHSRLSTWARATGEILSVRRQEDKLREQYLSQATNLSDLEEMQRRWERRQHNTLFRHF